MEYISCAVFSFPDMTFSEAETQRPARPKRRRPSDRPVEDETAPAMARSKSLLMTATVLLASSCCRVEGFSAGTSAMAAHQRLMRPAIENASDNHHHRHNPSSSSSLSPTATALQMVGRIRKQPANYPGGSAGGGRRSEQIARRHQELRSATERGDRRARPNQQNRRPGSSGSRTQKPLAAAATAEAPSTLNDSFRMRSGSHFEILMPDDITLSSSTSSSSSSSKSTAEAPLPTPDQLENAEAASRKSLVDAKIAALLAADDEEDDIGGNGGDGDIADDDLADRETVYTRLSDAAKSQATAAISKSNSYGAASSSADAGSGGGAPSLVASSTATAGSRHRVISKKKRVTAQVQETGRDTIRQSYTKSFTNHELLSRESEAALGREIQILARWEERRQELEVQLMR